MGQRMGIWMLCLVLAIGIQWETCESYLRYMGNNGSLQFFVTQRIYHFNHPIFKLLFYFVTFIELCQILHSHFTCIALFNLFKIKCIGETLVSKIM